ncbi:MAG: hypothetical protein LC647_14590, partial [Beggiatoa sp.]|nr:hypothetical protein [Beggiatoa sp.]
MGIDYHHNELLDQAVVEAVADEPAPVGAIDGAQADVVREPTVHEMDIGALRFVQEGEPVAGPLVTAAIEKIVLFSNLIL